MRYLKELAGALAVAGAAGCATRPRVSETFNADELFYQGPFRVADVKSLKTSGYLKTAEGYQIELRGVVMGTGKLARVVVPLPDRAAGEKLVKDIEDGHWLAFKPSQDPAIPDDYDFKPLLGGGFEIPYAGVHRADIGETALQLRDKAPLQKDSDSYGAKSALDVFTVPAAPKTTTPAGLTPAPAPKKP